MSGTPLLSDAEIKRINAMSTKIWDEVAWLAETCRSLMRENKLLRAENEMLRKRLTDARIL